MRWAAPGICTTRAGRRSSPRSCRNSRRSTAAGAAPLSCGGRARMIDAFVGAGRGRPPVTMHFERFAAAEAPAVEGGYTVVLQKSGRRLPVLSGKTLLDTLLDEDVSVPYACSNGICGTCLTGVVSGTPD